MRRVLVMGGSVGGLAVALALENKDCEVVIIERDPPPPEIAPEAAFEAWDRPGVPQFRHSHILLARLHTTLRDHHPRLLSELLDAGFEPSELGEMLPPSHVDGYEPGPADRDLLHLWGRRASFEYILRRHVGRLPHVRFVHSARVERLITEREGDKPLRVTGLCLRVDDRSELEHGDLVIDASGSRSKAPEWLREAGVGVAIEEHESRYAYVCRHYRLRDPAVHPSRFGTGANLDYLWYGLFYAEHGHFSIALACPVEETQLNELLKRADGFERTCERMPVLRGWTDVADPMSSVLGARGLKNRWVHYPVQGAQGVVGFLAAGDSHLHTNPMFGRGCSSAFVQAHALADAFASRDVAELATRYYARCRAQLRSHFESSIAADRLFLNRARLLRGAPVALGDRVLNILYDEAWTPTLLRSPFVAREMLKAMQMRELSDGWTRLRVLGHIVATLCRRLLGRARVEPPVLGPARTQLLSSLGLEEGASAQPTNAVAGLLSPGPGEKKAGAAATTAVAGSPLPTAEAENHPEGPMPDMPA